MEWNEGGGRSQIFTWAKRVWQMHLLSDFQIFEKMFLAQDISHIIRMYVVAYFTLKNRIGAQLLASSLHVVV